jgi:hypothetical protein
MNIDVLKQQLSDIMVNIPPEAEQGETLKNSLSCVIKAFEENVVKLTPNELYEIITTIIIDGTATCDHEAWRRNIVYAWSMIYPIINIEKIERIH